MTATATAPDTTREVKAALRVLARDGQRYLAAQRKADQANTTCREALAAAALLGVNVSELARASGLSRNAVYRALGRKL